MSYPESEKVHLGGGGVEVGETVTFNIASILLAFLPFSLVSFVGSFSFFSLFRLDLLSVLFSFYLSLNCVLPFIH